MGFDDTAECLIELCGHEYDPHITLVRVAPYGYVAQISQEHGVWRVRWRSEAAILTMRHHFLIDASLNTIVKDRNTLLRVTKRLLGK